MTADLPVVDEVRIWYSNGDPAGIEVSVEPDSQIVSTADWTMSFELDDGMAKFTHCSQLLRADLDKVTVAETHVEALPIVEEVVGLDHLFKESQTVVTAQQVAEQAGEVVDCPRCDGTGEQVRVGGGEIKTRCPNCDGTGEVREDE